MFQIKEPNKLKKAIASHKLRVQEKNAEVVTKYKQKLEYKITQKMKSKYITTKICVLSLPYPEYLEWDRLNPRGSVSGNFGFVQKEISIFDIDE